MQKVSRTYFMINVVLLGLLAFAAPFLETGSGSYVVAVLSLLPIVAGLLISGYFIRFDVGIVEYEYD